MRDFFKGKIILITGAAGIAGAELARQVSFFEPSELRLLDVSESRLFALDERYGRQGNVSCYLGDVGDAGKLVMLANNADMIFHCASFRQAILSEHDLFELVRTNVVGVENIIRAATSCNVGRVIFASGLQAVNSCDVAGTSKLLGERLMSAANAVRNGNNTVFSSLRLAEVIGPGGIFSFLPLLQRQIRKGGPVSIAGAHMTRFIMRAEEAAFQLLKAAVISMGGEVFVAKAPAARVSEIAQVLIEILAPGCGLMPSDVETALTADLSGQKACEEFLGDDELERAMELKDFFVVTPSVKSMFHSTDYAFPDVVSPNVSRDGVSAAQVPIERGALKEYLLGSKALGQETGVFL